ncbi:MAG: hypothetical protein Q4G33_02705 [bacterium]|nr:hypothetical protein [bacterium]
MNYSTAGGGRRKIRRASKIIGTVCAAALVGLYVLGATLGSDSEQRQKISRAVEENNQLRSELTAKDERINELEEEVRQLKAELEAIPTPAPTPYQPEPTAEPAPAETESINSPRE